MFFVVFSCFKHVESDAIVVFPRLQGGAYGGFKCVVIHVVKKSRAEMLP